MSKNLTYLINSALRAHATGNLEDARLLYQKVLAVDSENSTVLGWLGVIEAQGKNYLVAENLLLKALSKEKNNPDFLLNYAILLIEKKRYRDAIGFFQKVIRQRPTDPISFAKLAFCYNEENQPDLGLRNADQSIQFKPDYVDAWFNRGNALNNLKRHDEALTSYERVIALKPDYVEAWINRGTTLHTLKRYDDALTSYERALALKPDYVEAWSNRGNTLNALKRYDEAFASCERALALKPDYVDAWINRGTTLHTLKRYDEAFASYERALALNPDYVEAWFNRGTALNALKRYDDAFASYERALALKPDHVDASYNKALDLLSFERFRQGWDLYQSRWKVKTFNSSYIQTNIPPWSENMELKKLLVWAEQGIGDEIIYTSILANFTSPEIEVTLISDERLHPLLARSLPHIKLLDRKILKSFIEKNTFDAHIPIGDLGRLLSIDKNKLQLNAKPYLKPNLKQQEEYDLLFSDLEPSVICGIAWRSKNEAVGSDKSLSLLKLAPLFNLKNIKFVNLQYGDVGKEVEDVQMALGATIHINPNLDPTNDIDGLVSQINMCDMVVTTSNVTAHLAGAVGKKGVVLLPYSRGKLWYWHDGQGQSLWYPSLHLISQNKIDDWSECVDGATRWVKENM